MRGACLTENILYYAIISCDYQTYKLRLYKGICETTFEKRCANPKKLFNAEKNKSNAKLSTEYQKLASKKLHPRISENMKGNVRPYNPDSRKCSLCLYEILEIVDDPEEILLNILLNLPVSPSKQIQTKDSCV